MEKGLLANSTMDDAADYVWVYEDTVSVRVYEPCIRKNEADAMRVL